MLKHTYKSVFSAHTSSTDDDDPHPETFRRIIPSRCPPSSGTLRLRSANHSAPKFAANRRPPDYFSSKSYYKVLLLFFIFCFFVTAESMFCKRKNVLSEVKHAKSTYYYPAYVLYWGCMWWYNIGSIRFNKVDDNKIYWLAVHQLVRHSAYISAG